MAKKKDEAKAPEAPETPAPVQEPAKITRERVVAPDRIAEREAQGWKRVEGVEPLRNGSVLMTK